MDGRIYEITVAESGATFPCAADQFVFQAMLQAGCGPIRYGCGGGGCGICKMRVAAGRYEIVKAMSRAHLSPAEEAEGLVLICCIQPRGDLLLQHRDSPAVRTQIPLRAQPKQVRGKLRQPRKAVPNSPYPTKALCATMCRSAAPNIEHRT